MLGDKRMTTAIPVRDVDQARRFYEGLLGLKVVGAPLADGSLEYECGAGTGMLTYPTAQNAGKSPATLAAWEIDDIGTTVKELRGRGVVFEEYDLPGLKTEDGVATLPGARAAWFKDPDGNILNVFERD